MDHTWQPMMACLVTYNQTLVWAPRNAIYPAIELDENLDGRFPQSKHFGLIIGLKSHRLRD
jgi:hypothetical protein